jgi:hypothetical protein
LRLRADAYSRELYAIRAQRENDYLAERILQKDLAATLIELRELKDAQSDRNHITSPPKKFRPYLVERSEKSSANGSQNRDR